MTEPVRNPIQGIGIGFRQPYLNDVMKSDAKIDWLELMSDNFLHHSGPALTIAQSLAEKFPVGLHGVGMSIGSVDELDWVYLKKLKRLAATLNANSISDHLCFSSYKHVSMNDLLPLPRSEDCLFHIVDRVNQVQDYLGTQIILENISAYIDDNNAEMSLGEFFEALVIESGCGILLDVNNAIVNQNNLGHDAEKFIMQLPIESVQQIHLGGFVWDENIAVDTHGADVSKEVWELYRFAIQRFGQIPTCIERDQNLPTFEEMMNECRMARELSKDAQLKRMAS